MWCELASEIQDVELQDPVTPDALAAVEEQLGQPLPDALRQLLLETDGIEADYGTEAATAAPRSAPSRLNGWAAGAVRAAYAAEVVRRP
ncbi:SMI1/KNR4 family protein [Streptomyces sp. NPDC057889]|uniref:SMI1/KNR4 family protein n=1 Tax=unclassified Streptomyces TaxID=2593676 RepID=UPI003680D78F